MRAQQLQLFDVLMINMLIQCKVYVLILIICITQPLTEEFFLVQMVSIEKQMKLFALLVCLVKHAMYLIEFQLQQLL